MTKKRQRKGYYTLVNREDPIADYNRESFEDYCSACNEDGRFDPTNDVDWYKWANEESERDMDALVENLRYSKYINYPVLVEGTLGLWWGRPAIIPQFCEDVLQAIRYCVHNGDYATIRKAGHRIEIENPHHDGRNYFTITFLSPVGEARYRKNGRVSTRNRENFIKLPEYLF